MVKDRVKEKQMNNVPVTVNVCSKVNSRVVQQQDNWVEFFPRSVISSEGHYKIIEAVPCSLSRHNDELVLESVSLSILKTVVPATLHRKQQNRQVLYSFFSLMRDTEKTKGM